MGQVLELQKSGQVLGFVCVIMDPKRFGLREMAAEQRILKEDSSVW